MPKTTDWSKRKRDYEEAVNLIRQRYPYGGICEILRQPEEQIYDQDLEVCQNCKNRIQHDYPNKEFTKPIMRSGHCIFCGKHYNFPVWFETVRFFIGQRAKKMLGFNYKKSNREQIRKKRLGVRTHLGVGNEE